MADSVTAPAAAVDVGAVPTPADEQPGFKVSRPASTRCLVLILSPGLCWQPCVRDQRRGPQNFLQPGCR